MLDIAEVTYFTSNSLWREITRTQELAIDFHLGKTGNRHFYRIDLEYRVWWGVDSQGKSSNI